MGPRRVSKPLSLLAWLFNEPHFFHRAFIIFPHLLIAIYLAFSGGFGISQVDFLWELIGVSFLLGVATAFKPFLSWANH